MSNHIDGYYTSITKRTLDLFVAWGILFVGLPAFLIIGLVIKLTSRGTIFFVQERVGLKGKHFAIYKFRTMYENAYKDQEKYKHLNFSPPPTFKIHNDPRYTKFGAWLARTGLDELPQMINIIKNDMSLIGPRPFPVSEAKKLPQYWQFRTSVKPGILSSWAISGRNNMTLKKWAYLDKQDLAQASLATDLKILFSSLKYWF